MLNNKFHTHLSLKTHMNGGEGIQTDSYKESHEGNLVSDDVTIVVLTTPKSSQSWYHLYSLYSTIGN